MNRTARPKEASSGRVAFGDVSNRFNAECSKQAKAVASKQAKAAKAKSNKRAVSTLYLPTAPDASMKYKADKENGVTSKSVKSTKSEAPSVTQSVDNKHTNDVADSVTLRARAKPVQSKHFKATTKSYEDGTPHDIDKRDRNDPSCATAYVQDMYEYFREQEHRAVVVPYLEDQHKINARMRAILIDWLCTIHLKLKCEPEVLFLTVNIIDRYLCEATATRKNLQLIGTSALLVASKYEDIYPPDLGDLVYVCDGAYTKDEIIDMEETILKALNYQISLPTAYKFFVRFLNAGHADKKLVYLSSFILEQSLLSYDLVSTYKPSELAAAAVLLGRSAIDRNSWSPTLLKYTQYREEDVKPVARAMLAANNAQYPGLHALKSKYSRSSKHRAASIELPSSL
ncbi:hypothetical protein ACHAXT_007761 [Thalassiosira profunda]